jgi:hypothetical protein
MEIKSREKPTLYEGCSGRILNVFEMGRAGTGIMAEQHRIMKGIATSMLKKLGLVNEQIAGCAEEDWPFLVELKLRHIRMLQWAYGFLVGACMVGVIVWLGFLLL